MFRQEEELPGPGKVQLSKESIKFCGQKPVASRHALLNQPIGIDSMKQVSTNYIDFHFYGRGQVSEKETSFKTKTLYKD